MGDLPFSPAAISSKFRFLLLERDDCEEKSGKRKQAVYPKDTLVSGFSQVKLF